MVASAPARNLGESKIAMASACPYRNGDRPGAGVDVGVRRPHLGQDPCAPTSFTDSRSPELVDQRADLEQLDVTSLARSERKLGVPQGNLAQGTPRRLLADERRPALSRSAAADPDEHKCGRLRSGGEKQIVQCQGTARIRRTNTTA